MSVQDLRQVNSTSPLKQNSDFLKWFPHLERGYSATENMRKQKEILVQVRMYQFHLINL